MMWQKDEEANQPTEAWNNLDMLQYETSPFTTDDLFGEENSIHEFSRIIKRLLPQAPKYLYTVEDWKRVYINAFEGETQLAQSKNGERLRAIAIRMALTSPYELFEKDVWEGSTLRSRHDTIMWRAAYEIFGAPWHQQTKKRQATEEPIPGTPIGTRAMIEGQYTIDLTMRNTLDDTVGMDSNTKEGVPIASSADKTTTNESKMDKTTGKKQQTNEQAAKNDFATTNNKDRTTDNDNDSTVSSLAPEVEPPIKLFLSKPLYKKVKKTKITISPYERLKYTTFCVLKLPHGTKDTILEGNNELVNNFNNVIQKIIQVDPKAMILPWNDDSDVTPLKKGERLPTTRSIMEFYVDRTYVEKGKEPWCRIHMTHNKKIETICEDRNWFRKQGVWFKKDEIQVKNHIAAGWLLGSHPAMNLQDLREAILRHPEMHGIPIAIKFQVIRLQTKGKIAATDQVRAAHVITEYNRVSEMRGIMRAIYDKPGDLGLPLGIVLRFVPNVADSRYKGSTSTRNNCKKLRNKQRNFLNNTEVQSSMALQYIDYAIKDQGSLRNIIMGLEAHNSTAEQKHHLFIGVDESQDEDKVTFIFRKENADQAAMTISAFPLILQEHYGARCGNWLTEHANKETAEWVYDIQTGTIKSKEDEYTSKILEGWGQDSENEPTTPQVHIVLGETNEGNQFDDNGTVLTMESSVSGYSSASNEIPSVDRMLKKMQKLMENNISDEDKQRLQNMLNGNSPAEGEQTS